MHANTRTHAHTRSHSSDASSTTINLVIPPSGDVPFKSIILRCRFPWLKPLYAYSICIQIVMSESFFVITKFSEETPMGCPWILWFDPSAASQMGRNIMQHMGNFA